MYTDVQGSFGGYAVSSTGMVNYNWAANSQQLTYNPSSDLHNAFGYVMLDLRYPISGTATVVSGSVSSITSLDKFRVIHGALMLAAYVVCCEGIEAPRQMQAHMLTSAARCRASFR